MSGDRGRRLDSKRRSTANVERMASYQQVDGDNWLDKRFVMASDSEREILQRGVKTFRWSRFYMRGRRGAESQYYSEVS